ncbi:MAG TPA: peroxidase family protein, partial [Candidatus Saccharimonadales bacterium]|nr:peroxidase family protein [Candidatus Saccharimonadales bacterium]
MARIQHGEVASLQEVEKAVTSLKQENEKLGMAAAPLREAGLTRFDYMFPQLQANGSLLVSEKPEKLVEDLIHLGYTMNDQDENKEFDSGIPAAYTYFGQFVAHDITLELQSDQIAKLTDPKLVPLTSNVVRSSIKNRRSPTLDLDCVYGVTSDGSPVPRVGHALAVGVVSKSGDRPQGTDENNDLPRKPPSKNPPTDREALIGDARNDQNLILAQLHVAFLRAHNSLVNDGMTYSKARKALVEHYQWL